MQSRPVTEGQHENRENKMSAPEKAPAQHIGAQSALRLIFAGGAIQRMERIARANRCRDLIASLAPSVQAMGAQEKAHFAELSELVRMEHVAACEEEHEQHEIDNAQSLVLEALEEVRKLTETNKRLTVLAARLQADHDAALVQEHNVSPWRRLLNMANKPPQSQE